jgi:5'(3')-deoxyribonucleotidase
MICLLDMDGVVADFVGGVCAAHNRPSPYDDPSSYGVFDMDKLWGMTSREFWKPCDGESFWDDLQKTPDADDIVSSVVNNFGLENIAILTAPSMSPYCVPGKRRWMKRHYPFLAKNMIFTSAKKFLAGPDRVLIDDRNENIESFRAAGGHGILLPRLWNRLYRMWDFSLDHVEVNLRDLKEVVA